MLERVCLWVIRNSSTVAYKNTLWWLEVERKKSSNQDRFDIGKDRCAETVRDLRRGEVKFVGLRIRGRKRGIWLKEIGVKD